ncbi:MAG: aromatic ring-hydroxylating dioxygenase subunit alpha [Gammaproteobacteria bacterium]|nr:aromatic ring-hydroxylating dioxygenase subunit alpha [Gammaproteobacteria bacterium]MCZ6686499.1 aromatic ring-hydroxylating dioxygenase subunit alpha [Gammaproteobacteria bacterium]TDJ12973.1 MAG: aromatic ring-hydroxylating dioxygenase subunit alpha [Gammaproteobacteria bacterium]
MIQPAPSSPGNQISMSLPAWTYSHPEFFELEKQRIFRRSWQVVCHVSDIPEPGDYFRFDFLDEPLVILRDKRRDVRAFSNVCRHRAARLLDGENGSMRGTCSDGLIRCPYHAWTYDLDGRLTHMPYEGTYQGFRKQDCRLPEIAADIWMGFIFISLEPATPTVSEIMAPFDESLSPLRMDEMKALGRASQRPRRGNWKNVVDNYVDGLHINVAHPGLRGIAGKNYRLSAGEHVQHIQSQLHEGGTLGWSERMYLKVLPERADLPAERRRLWEYFLLWPNTAFDIYPDQVDFMQMLPLSPGKTLIREISYALPDESREMRLARYLNWRVNRKVNAEDRGLVERVQHGMGSSGFKQGPLASSEVCLKIFADKIRSILPVAKLAEEPVGSLAPE